MSFNFTLAILADTSLDQLGADGPAISFDEATSMTAEVLTAAQVGPHVVLADPLFGEGAALLATEGRQLYVVVLSGVVDQYVVQAAGPVERLRVQLQGNVVEDQGDPLPAEAALAEAEWAEDGHVLMIERLLGAPISDVMDAEFRPLTLRA